MIKVTKKKTVLKGNVLELMYDYTKLTKSLVKTFEKQFPHDKAVELVKLAHDTAFMTPEEIIERQNELFNKMFERMFGAKEETEKENKNE